MKKTIIVAGEREVNISRICNNVIKQGYRSIPCRTVQEIIEELKVLSAWDEHVSLVIIEPEILKNINDDLAAELIQCFVQSPFSLTTINNINEEYSVHIEC